MNKYNHNQMFFSSIDAEAKAYILGFIAADGNLYKRQNINSWLLTIELKKEDKDILEKIKKHLDFDGPIHSVIKKDREYQALRITSHQLCYDLFCCGITPRKTNKLTPPDLQPNLIRHYLRGYYDGDGSIVIRKNKAFLILPSASPNFLQWVQQHLSSITNANVSIYKDKSKKNDLYRLDYGSFPHVEGNSVLAIVNYLYKDATIYLDRKYNKYQQVLELSKISRPTRMQLKQQTHGHKIQRSDGKIYPSISEAARDVGSRVMNIKTALSNPNRSCKGFKWKYFIT